jgi:hypothetical protein
MVINVPWPSCKATVTLVRLEWKLNFINRVLKSTQIPNFTKIPPVGGELLHADGQTDMTKLIVAFRNFREAPKPGQNIQRYSFNRTDYK